MAVDAGRSLAVIGPSGSGKTTLLALLSGLYQPTKGRVEFEGAPLVGAAGPPPGMAVVLQRLRPGFAADRCRERRDRAARRG